MSNSSSSRLTRDACTIDDTTMSNSNAGNAYSISTDEGRVSCCVTCCPDRSSCGADNNNNNNNKNNIADSRFSCNICFDAVVEPVVTRCGHLYCWPCLFRWLEPGMLPEERQSLGMSYVYNTNNNSGVINRRECPVCKSECSLSSLVPVYVRSSIRDDDDKDVKDEKSLANKNNKREQTTIDDDTNTSVRNGNGNDTIDVKLDSGDDNVGDDSFINETPEKGAGIDLDESLPDGLRRRRMTSDNSISNSNSNSNSNANNNNNNNAVIPNRPSATNSPQQQPSSPVISSANNNNNSNNINSNNNSPPSSSSRSRSNGWITPRSPHGHNASLTHGILLSFQRATAEYYRNSNNNNTNHSNQYDQNQQQIPSLHDRRNPSSRNNNNNNNIGDATSSAGRFQEGQQQADVNSETTQYLSRLLIMLTSFVILCLLLV
jgi:hypothetical protein